MGAAEAKGAKSASGASAFGQVVAPAAQGGDVAAVGAPRSDGGKSTAGVKGHTPLHIACSRAHLRSDTAYLEALLADPSTNVNAVDSNGRTALHAALSGPTNDRLPPSGQANLLACVRVLLRAGADVHARTARGETALHLGAHLSKEIVDELLAAGADAKAVTLQGYNALSYAFRTAQVDVIRTLLAAGASPNVSSLRNEALIWSALAAPECLTALADAGADTTPLHLRGRRDGATLLFTVVSVQTLRVLLSLGLDVNARDNTGCTALFSQLQSPDAVRLFIEAGINVNAQDARGNTVLHHLTRDYPRSAPPMHLLDALLDAGADINVKDKYNNTPLMEARKTGRMELVEHLITRGKCEKIR